MYFPGRQRRTASDGRTQRSNWNNRYCPHKYRCIQKHYWTNLVYSYKPLLLNGTLRKYSNKKIPIECITSISYNIPKSNASGRIFLTKHVSFYVKSYYNCYHSQILYLIWKTNTQLSSNLNTLENKRRVGKRCVFAGKGRLYSYLLYLLR